MEYFDTNQRNVKEKSVYLLHLDAPRIVILVSVLIGLIIISFLIGMNFAKDENESNIVANSDILFNSDKDSRFAENSISTLPDKNIETLEAKNKNPDLINDDMKDRFFENSEKDNNDQTADILTSDNIKEILPPSDKVAVKKEKKKKVKKNKKKKETSRYAKKNKKNKSIRTKKKRGKSRIIEVSSKYENKFNATPNYSIQVASFDRISKAKKEVNSLRELKYDAHVSSTFVNGSKFYRVKVGPILSKRKAINLLNDIQEINRYRNSYMVKE